MVTTVRSFDGEVRGAQLLSMSVFRDVTEVGIMLGDRGDIGILCEMEPVTGNNSEGRDGMPDRVETVTVVIGEGARTVVVVAVTNGCPMGGPGEFPSPGESLATDTVLNSGAFKAGAGTT